MPAASWTTATGLPRYGTSVNTSTWLNGRTIDGVCHEASTAALRSARLGDVDREGLVEKGSDPVDLGSELGPRLPCPRRPSPNVYQRSPPGAEPPRPADAPVDEHERRDPAGGPIHVAVVGDRQDRFDPARQLVGEGIEPGQETDATKRLLPLQRREIARPNECPCTVNVDGGERDRD